MIDGPSLARYCARAALKGVLFVAGYVAILFTSLAVAAALICWALSGPR